MGTATDEYAESVTAATTDYLDSVRACTALLPATVLRYGEPAFQETAERLADRETACDEHLRDVRRLLGDAEPNYTDVYLRTAEVMELYELLDDVPNAAERFVRDLDAIRPDLSAATRDDFAKLSALASRATWLLTDLLDVYVTQLVTAGPGSAVLGEVQRVGGLEARADDRKFTVVTRSFDRLETADAVVVRELAESLDATLDAAEDAADHLLFVASGH